MHHEPLENLRVKVSPIAAPGSGGGRWCASARITGYSDGAPFSMVIDMCAQSFATRAEAVRYGELKAEARLQELFERRAPR